jgi:hypothetical protein
VNPRSAGTVKAETHRARSHPGTFGLPLELDGGSGSRPPTSRFYCLLPLPVNYRLGQGPLSSASSGFPLIALDCGNGRATVTAAVPAGLYSPRHRRTPKSILVEHLSDAAAVEEELFGRCSHRRRSTRMRLRCKSTCLYLDSSGTEPRKRKAYVMDGNRGRLPPS